MHLTVAASAQAFVELVVLAKLYFGALKKSNIEPVLLFLRLRL